VADEALEPVPEGELPSVFEGEEEEESSPDFLGEPEPEGTVLLPREVPLPEEPVPEEPVPVGAGTAAEGRAEDNMEEAAEAAEEAAEEAPEAAPEEAAEEIAELIALTLAL